MSTTNANPSSMDSLPSNLRNGMISMGIFGILSSISSIALLSFITYRMIFWKRFYHRPISSSQTFILIYNLLIADFQQALSFLLSFYWLSQNKLTGPSSTCFAQGWLIQIGDLSSGLWVLSIAVHTGITLIAQKSISQRQFLCAVLAIWAFALFLTALGPILHGKDFFVPAGAWCWINEIYQTERLCLHYLWIFTSELGSIVIYGAIFVVLRWRLSDYAAPNLASLPTPNFALSARNTTTTVMTSKINDPFAASRDRVAKAARYMVIYPFAYVALTLPLAIGRVSAMTGKNPSLTYYCVAGSLMACCGFIDVILYLWTRKALIKSSVGMKTVKLPTMNQGGSGHGNIEEPSREDDIDMGSFRDEDKRKMRKSDGILVSQSIVQSRGSNAWLGDDRSEDSDRIHLERPISQRGLVGENFEKEDKTSWLKP